MVHCWSKVNHHSCGCDDWCMATTFSSRRRWHATCAHHWMMVKVCQSIQKFMPENFMPAMVTIAACLIGANYISVLKMLGCCGVPMLTGAPGSCKSSEAAKCGLALFGGHESHCFNNQSTPHILQQTTVPVVIDDITAKPADTWEELFIDAYNSTSRATRSYEVESFSTLPVVSSNWKLGAECPCAHSRAIHIGLNEHTDEPEANLLFAKMQRSRDTASVSVGDMLKLSGHRRQRSTSTT